MLGVKTGTPSIIELGSILIPSSKHSSDSTSMSESSESLETFFSVLESGGEWRPVDGDRTIGWRITDMVTEFCDL